MNRRLHNNQSLMKKWRSWRYKNTFVLLVSLVAFYWLAKTPALDSIMRQIGALGYLGAFVIGIFFVSTFTVVPAAVILFRLADTLHPVEVALLAGLGAMIGDYLIFRYMKGKVFEELLPLMRKMKISRIKILFNSPYFAWVVPVFGAFVIASPFPDEVGVSMLGLTKIKKWQFFLLVFGLNALGILLIVSAARL